MKVIIEDEWGRRLGMGVGMNRMTSNGDQTGDMRSRLEVLPPSAQVVSQEESTVDTPRPTKKQKSKAKRKLRVEPLAETTSASVTEAIDPEQEKSPTKKSRRPLPLAVPAKPEVEATLTPTSNPSPPSEVVPSHSEQSQPEPLSVPVSREAQLHAIGHWHTAVEAEPVPFTERVSKFMSGWATSFVVHTLLIIAFALLTFGMPDDSPISISLANVDVEKLDSNVFDVSVDFEPLDDSGGVELDNLEPEDLSEELTHETMEASEDILAPLDEFGVEALAGDGIDAGFDSGGLAEGASGRKGVAGESIDFFGSFAEGQRFVFVIDCSGSMNGDRWTRAKYELERSIDGLGAEQEFCVVLYNSYTTVMLDSRKVELLKATEDNKEKVVDWLERQYPNGGTYPRPAVMAALDVTPDSIFLLSDGEIQDNTREFLLARNTFEDPESGSFAKIPVHTIALLSQRGQEILRTIADENEGTFTNVGRR